MVLIQLLLPTSGAADADGLAPLAQTCRELTDRFSGLTAYLRSPAKEWWNAMVTGASSGIGLELTGLHCDGATDR